MGIFEWNRIKDLIKEITEIILDYALCKFVSSRADNAGSFE